ncbi:MAG TPA: decarboxylating 6-phosphogluconate dehydrogenase [Gammaproteobacteria bacterium]
MRIAMIGLGRMGGNMTRRLCRRGIAVVGYDRSREVVEELQREEGMIAAESALDAVKKLTAPRVVWLMLPAGKVTEQQLDELQTVLEPGDIIIDGGNSNYHDSQRRGDRLCATGIGFIDAGTSGGIWGLDEGYCMMVGGELQHVKVIEPLLRALAPGEEHGWAHVGPVGAGHFTKMVHNGIEYGMMQAFAEGFELLRGKQEFRLDLAQIAELWRHGSVVRSWLLDLTAGALAQDQALTHIEPLVPDSGEGRWTAVEAIEQGVALPVISLALQMRFSSQDREGYQARLLAMMRNAFGGHEVFRKA